MVVLECWIPWLPGSVAIRPGDSGRWKRARARAPRRRGRAVRRPRRRPRKSLVARRRDRGRTCTRRGRWRSGPGLDPGEVHVARRELRQAAHEPARAGRARAPEHQRGLEAVAGRIRLGARAARSRRSASRCPGRPRRPRAARRSRSASAAPRVPIAAAPDSNPSATWRTASAVDGAGDHRRAGQRLAQEARALAARLRVRDDGADRVELPAAPPANRCRCTGCAARRRSPRRRSRTRSRRASG